MKKTYIIHIETQPLTLTELLAKAPEFKAASNLKDPAKIAEDIEKKKNKYISEAQFNDNTCEVCAVGLTNLETGTQRIVGLYGGDALVEDEHDIFEWLHDNLKSNEDPNDPWADTITFRGEKFIYPLLARKGARYGFSFFSAFYSPAATGRLKDSNHFDIAKRWACGSLSHPENLQEVARMLSIHHVISNVPYYKLAQENSDEAEAYFLNTLDALEEIYNTIKSV